jgi:hypothetical protein
MFSRPPATSLLILGACLSIVCSLPSCGSSPSKPPREVGTVLHGTVLESETGMPLSNVDIHYVFGGQRDLVGQTDSAGEFEIDMGPGLVSDGALRFAKKATPRYKPTFPRTSTRPVRGDFKQPSH